MLRQFFGSVGPCLFLAGLLAATAARGEDAYQTGLEPFEISPVHRSITGKVELGPTCAAKTDLTAMKILITAERSLDYGHAMPVEVGADGAYQVSLQQAYNYRFRLMHGGEQVASGRFEPRYPDRLPRLIAQCPVALPNPEEKPAATH